MNEEERSSQVSALFDGELDAEQANLVTRRLLKDPALRASWGRYAMISASLRGEPLSMPRPGRGDPEPDGPTVSRGRPRAERHRRTGHHRQAAQGRPPRHLRLGELCTW